MNLSKQISLFALILIFSCNSTDDSNSTISEEPQLYQIETVLNQFIEQNPNWNNNDVSKEDFKVALAKELNPKIEEGILFELPFKFGGVERFTEKGKVGYIGRMDFEKDKVDRESIAKTFILSVLVFLDKPAVDTLKQGNVYKFQGEFKGFRSEQFLIFEKFGRKEIESIHFPMARFKITDIRYADVDSSNK